MQMKKSVRILLIIAASCLGVGIILIGIGVLTGAKRGMTWDTTHGVKALESQKFTYDSGAVKDIQYVDIDVSNAKIQVLQSDNDSFDLQVNYEYDSQQPVVDVSGNRMSVAGSYGWNGFTWNFSLFNFDWFDAASGNVITIYVPRDAKVSSMKLSTSNGDITSQPTFTADTLVIDTSNGAVDVRNITSPQSTEIKSSNGSIQCSGQFGGNTNIKTSNGKIEASGTYKGKTICKSSNSEIGFTTTLDRKNYGITARTSNGNARINGSKVGDDYSENNTTENTVDLGTSNGNITMQFSH
jgi:hypothetical protein